MQGLWFFHSFQNHSTDCSKNICTNCFVYEIWVIIPKSMKCKWIFSFFPKPESIKILCNGAVGRGETIAVIFKPNIPRKKIHGKTDFVQVHINLFTGISRGQKYVGKEWGFPKSSIKVFFHFLYPCFLKYGPWTGTSPENGCPSVQQNK